MNMEYEIRKYQMTDLSSLYKICLLTANNGHDASLLLKDSDLVGHLYAAPYAFFEPNLCFILLKDAMPCGYTGDTEFYKISKGVKRNGFLNCVNGTPSLMKTIVHYRLAL